MMEAKTDLRKLVWDMLVKHGGNREATAKELGKSVRTLNRYIKDLNLYPDMDKAGFIHHAGPPREADIPVPTKSERIIAYIREVNYHALCLELYGSDSRDVRTRLFVALNKLKADGRIGKDEERWFVIRG